MRGDGTGNKNERDKRGKAAGVGKSKVRSMHARLQRRSQEGLYFKELPVRGCLGNAFFFFLFLLPG